MQNETDSEQEGQMPQCQWGQQYDIAFVKIYLGLTLRKAGLEPKSACWTTTTIDRAALSVVLGTRQLQLNLPPHSLFTLRWGPNA